MTINLPSVFKDGTATIANGGTVVTVAGALLVNSVLPGDFFGVHKGFSVRIASVDSDTQLTLANPWPGTSQVAGPYEIMLQSDMARMQESTRQLLERMQSGNLYALAGLAGVADNLPIFTGPGAFGLISKADLTAGVDYDVQVDTLGDRTAYDANAAGFSVLVSNIGDGRTAIYSKKSNAVGDWSAPGYVTGPVGPMPTLAVDSTTTLAAGSPASVGVTPVTGGYNLEFGIPRGRGFTERGAYNPATAYVLDDGVQSGGSSWICILATTGHAPPALPTTSNTWWTLVAAKGTDGTGIGDMVKATYDPGNKATDTFNSANHVYSNTTSGLKSSTSKLAIDELALLMPGFRSGLVLSNNAIDSNNDIDISPGARADDSSKPVMLKLTATMTKQLDVAWAAGSGNGGLDVTPKGVSKSLAGYIIGGPGVPDDVIFTSNFGAPTMPAGYTLKRYIGSVIVSAAGNNFTFTQVGNYFRLFSYGGAQVTTTVGTASVLVPLPIPSGASFLVHLRGRVINATLNPLVLLRNPADADLAPAFATLPFGSLGGVGANTTFIGIADVFSDSSRQIAARAAGAATTLDLSVIGWEDPYL